MKKELSERDLTKKDPKGRLSSKKNEEIPDKIIAALLNPEVM